MCFEHWSRIEKGKRGRKVKNARVHSLGRVGSWAELEFILGRVGTEPSWFWTELILGRVDSARSMYVLLPAPLVARSRSGSGVLADHVWAPRTSTIDKERHEENSMWLSYITDAPLTWLKLDKIWIASRTGAETKTNEHEHWWILLMLIAEKTQILITCSRYAVLHFSRVL